MIRTILTGLAVLLMILLAVSYPVHGNPVQLEEMATLDTCTCPTQDRLTTGSFKACKLLSLRETMNNILEIVKDYKRDLEVNHGIFPNITDMVDLLSQDDLLHLGYRKIQYMALHFQVLETIEDHVVLSHESCTLRNKFQRLMCQIEPVIVAGHFQDGYEQHDCTVQMRMEHIGNSRESIAKVITFTTNIVQNALMELRLMIASINHLLRID